ncbi:zinc knuckle domain-containing protein [Hirsutella rhossiliensis]|uniref:Zinc knuckle domain-containing protein n=1 Tax=Hirsutella rhossiliensis TaxID=111463 RepID=A0A9P8N1P5_9HYPO|nr:zinc knuckle domain-containing protein [Hirsutella rhossiliensis]KAH0963087.1 zinc knuckle domain-containing protein [Hirsutella rhossiliensis]
MKFMQRAAASASSAASPDSAGPSKKRKHQHSPAQGRFDAQIDQALIQAALDDQEATRQAALEKHAAADTHWTLDNTWDKAATADATSTPLNVVYVGYGDIDSDNESGAKEDAPARGRTSTKVEKKPASKARLDDEHAAPRMSLGLTVLQHRGKKRESPDDKSGSHSSDESNEASRKRKHRDVSSDVDSPLSQDRSRSKSRTRQNQEGAKAKEFRDKRKKKEVRLDQITSISSGGGGGSPSGGRGLTCYACQQTGHKSSDCPKRSKGSSRRKS